MDQTPAKSASSSTRGIGVVWVILCALTILSYYLAVDSQGGAARWSWATAPVFIIAFVKVRMVQMHFMNAGRGGPLLRVFVECWVLLVAAVLIVLFEFGQPFSLMLQRMGML